MKTYITCILFFLILLTSCEWVPPPIKPSNPDVEPTHTPSILIPTSVIPLPTNTSTQVLTPSQTPEVIPTMETPSPTATFTSTPIFPLQAEVIGCNTSLDITHQMGEVTNGFALIRNFSDQELTNVCATLSAIDEDREHPDKTACVKILPSRNQVIFKLTVDTQFQLDTSIRVDVKTDQSLSVSVMEESCRDIGLFQGNPDETGVVRPIP